MPRYCLDASFVLAWLIPAQRTSAIQQRWLTFTGDDDLMAPPLVLAECTSILHQQVQTGRMIPDFARRLLAMLLRLPIRLVERPQVHETAFEIAQLLRWEKAYDSEYVAVAQIEDGELLTLDRVLHRGAQRLSVRSTLVRA